jgi:RNA polymerase sigma-70 factor (ECF subfamily)
MTLDGPSGGATSDEDLMLACRTGVDGAFDALFARYRHVVWGYFRRRLRDAQRAEELAQETFLAVLRGAARYQPRSAFRSYLFGIAFNLLAAERRRAVAQSVERLTPIAPVDAPAEPETILWLRQALDRLDASDREIVMLREIEQLSYGEICDVLALPLTTVRSRLFRARIQLRRLLAAGPSASGESR